MLKKFLAIFAAMLCLTACQHADDTRGNAPTEPTGSTTVSTTESAGAENSATSSTDADGTDDKKDTTTFSDKDTTTKKGDVTDAKTTKKSSTTRTRKTITSKKTTTTAVVNYEEGINVIRQEAYDLRLTKEALDRSIVSEGDQVRIANVIKKAKRGEPVTIAVIGGSITQGASASNGNSYAKRLEAWWRTTFPDSELTFINAGVGGTGSVLGVQRVQKNVLNEKPDLVIVEFSVNDTDEPLCQETYEGLVRKILKQSNNPAVILLFMMDQNGNNTQRIHSEIGKRYNLPMISYRNALLSKTGMMLYQWSEISPDYIHPNDTGHAIVGELLFYYLNGVRTKLNTISGMISALPSPVTANGYENAVLLDNRDITPTSLGSFQVNNNAFYYTFKNGWTVKGGKEPIVFELEATKNIYILYSKVVGGIGGKVVVKVDGKKVGTLDAHYPGAGDLATTFGAYTSVTPGKHTVSIQLIDGGIGNQFSIMGILKS